MHHTKVRRHPLFIFLPLFIIAGLFFLSEASANPINGKKATDETINAPYLQKNPKRFQLVFFGYVGCQKVCTPMLHELSAFYESPRFSPLKPLVGFSFVNLVPEMEPHLPQAYAHGINRNFIGIHLNQKELDSIDKEFSLFIAKRLNEPGELDHSDHLYLIERDKNGTLLLKNIYHTHPLDKEKVIADIKAML